MNLLQNIFKPKQSDVPLTEEELDAEDAAAKKARIEQHFRSVRNGPVKWSGFSAGQQRRQQARDKVRFERKVNRQRRQAFKDGQRATAVLRGHLIILGQIECRHDATTFSERQKQESAVWVVRKFGARDDSGELITGDDLLIDALKAARAEFLAQSGVTERPDLGEGVHITNRPSTVSA